MKKKHYFRQVSPKVDFLALEEKLLSWWYQSGLVKKYLQKNTKSKKRFSFLDGPITANNPMGVHHAWGRTLKDLFQRYKNMQGFRERFQNGFDNQGLWVEVEVERGLGFKSKRDIEKYGIEKFVNKCKEHTLNFAKVQTEQSKRLGYFMDWENSYYTLSDENNYMIWHFLKKCHAEGNLYKGEDSIPWCPRCGTAISQHEILTEEYQEITHDSIFFKAPIKGRKNQYFLVWTTTPWTIPANVALAVNPDFTYGAYQKKGSDETLILLADLKNKVLGKDWEEVKKYQGKKLKGWVYQGPFDGLPPVQAAKRENPKTFHTLLTSKDLVTATEGTGVVHIAPGAGQEDFQLSKEEKLPVIAAIDEEASYLSGFGAFSGKNAKNHPEIIIDALKRRQNGKFLFKVEPYTHRYPVCWRCKTELVWRVVEEWYLAMDPLRDRMKKVAKKIKWIPAWGLDQELDWLSNMHDWLISKKRYWGLALPIWECQKCGHFEVIGGKEELQKKAVSGWKEFEGHSPHRPWVDDVKIKCPQCGEVVSRIPDVGNPWLDAGIVPFSTMPEDWFPADFITECFPGQFKNWFYSLIAMSTVLEDKPPFKTLLGHALVRDEKGEEMHKSKGNAIQFNEAAEKMGVDTMRWLYLSQNPVHNLNFGFRIADQARRRFHLTLWNIYNFFVTYANVDSWHPHEDFKVNPTKLDSWILTRLNQTALDVSKNLENFDYHLAAQTLQELVSDLSLWYVRRSRSRVGPTAQDEKDKDLTYTTLYLVLKVLSKLLAPFIPFVAEEIYQNLESGGKLQVSSSVHLADWPKLQTEEVLDKKLLSQMKLIRKVCELGHAARKKAKIKVRQPLKSLRVKGEDGQDLSEELVQLIKDELNVKKIFLAGGKGELKVELDKKITPELALEGEARELVRKIQELRKEKGCRLEEKIVVTTASWPKDFEDEIKNQTLATEIKKGDRLRIATCQNEVF